MKEYYVGLDVSQNSTAICVIDKEGNKVCEGSSFTRAQDIYGWLKRRVEISEIVQVGLEAGNMSSWLYTELTKLSFKVVCMETFQAHRFLATYRNKTDKNDARGLAQLLRMGGKDFLKIVVVRSQASQEIRALLSMRSWLVSLKVSLENHISGILKPFGYVIARGCVPKVFFDRTVEALDIAERNNVKIKSTVTPSLYLYMRVSSYLDPLQKQVEELASNIEMVKRFMQIPGVGPITALSFYTAVDSPMRFKKSSDVAAYFGLTPRQFQSGESNYYAGISKRGDPSTRRALVQAATVLLYKTDHWCSLKAWGVRLAKRIGFGKARIAVARKLAIIMHKMWVNDDRFRPKSLTPDELADVRKILKQERKSS